ncbi:hypothetical protein GCM10027562_09010 [Arthrobacter pigmenti]
MIYPPTQLPVDNFCAAPRFWGITETMNETHQQPDGDEAVGSSPPSLRGYRSGRRLGTGGSASVWLVTSEHDGRQFAAKVFPPDGDSVTASQLRREMELLERLDHEHLVRLHEVLEAGDGLTLLMDYAAGDSLAALVGARGPLPVEEVVTILTPVARCLAYLHSHGVTHSDVAPGNVLFTQHGKPLLADLGLGRMTGQGGTSTAGTAGFAAVDTTVRGQHGRLRPEDDIHGLAALGWYALTGRVPASSDRRPPLPMVIPGVPEELALIIEAGLHPSPEQRPSAAEFEQAVLRSAQPAPVNLVPVVHESVLPHLLTRRNVLEQERQSGKRRRRFTSWKFRAPKDNPSRATNTKRPPRRRNRTRAMAAGGIFLAAVVSAGAVLAGGGAEPAVLSERTRPSQVPGSQEAAARPEATGSPEPGPSSDTEPSAGTAAPDNESAEGPRPSSSRSRLPSGLPDGMQEQLKSADPREAVKALAWLRSHAFSSGQTALLDRVNLAGSPAMSADRRIARRIEQAHHVFAGFMTEIKTVEHLQPGDAEQLPKNGQSGGARQNTAFMAVTASSDGFVEKDRQGKIIRRHQKGQQQQLVLELRHVDGRWLIANVLAAGSGG